MSNLQIVATGTINSTTGETSIEIIPILLGNFIVSYYTLRNIIEDEETVITFRCEDQSEDVLINEFSVRVSDLRWKSSACFPSMRENFIDGTNPIYVKVYSERDITFTLDFIGYEV